MFEQIRLANIYVHYSDVQFSKGSFVNRVQIKTSKGPNWLTVPLREHGLDKNIDSIEINNSTDWRGQHLRQLEQAYSQAPFFSDMIELAKDIYSIDFKTIDQISRRSLEIVIEYFDLAKETKFLDSGSLAVGGKGSQRVLDIVRKLSGNIYITGHGAKNYLDHEAFESNGIRVEYMNYKKSRYPQRYGEFTPFVSILDLIANVGPSGKKFIHSETQYWRDYI